MARLFVDSLSVLDFSYLDPARGVVGESWIVDIELEGELNQEGMVFDFGHVKKLIKAAVDSGMDHRFVVPEQLPGLLIDRGPASTSLKFSKPDYGMVLEYEAPHEAFYWLNATAVTLESALADVQAQVRSVVPDNVSDVQVQLRPEVHDESYYHYSHGLKKHQGDCQRMIHGHRSRILIEQDNQRRPTLEAVLAAQWQDIYLVTREDIVGERSVLDVPCYDIAYTAEQGPFHLTLPVSRCHIMETDTTVELIAQHILDRHITMAPTSTWQVRAFEGVNKGAVASHNR